VTPCPKPAKVVKERKPLRSKRWGVSKSKRGTTRPPNNCAPLHIDPDHFWARVTKTEGCWEWSGPRNRGGYGYPWIGNGHHRLAHRVSWELTNGRVAGDLLVLHHCDNPSCVRPDHLYLGTSTDNNRDALKRGRNRFGDNRGEKNSWALVTEAEVIDIRAAYDRGELGISIAVRMGLKASTVRAILRRENWKHIPGPERLKSKHQRRERMWGRMAFIRSRACVLRAYGCRGAVQAHHAGKHGMGQRPSDDTVISICDGHHDALHDGGEPFSSWGKASIRDWENREIEKARAAWDALPLEVREAWDRMATPAHRRAA
jgi:hypothetical protein